MCQLNKYCTCVEGGGLFSLKLPCQWSPPGASGWRQSLCDPFIHTHTHTHTHTPLAFSSRPSPRGLTQAAGPSEGCGHTQPHEADGPTVRGQQQPHPCTAQTTLATSTLVPQGLFSLRTLMCRYVYLYVCVCIFVCKYMHMYSSMCFSCTWQFLLRYSIYVDTSLQHLCVYITI